MAMAEKVQLKGKRVLVIGLARTGVATGLFCAQRGARVTATDTRTAEELGESVAKLHAVGVQLQLGGYTDAILHTQQLVVPSPGVPADAPLLAKAREQGIPVWSEIELAYRFLPADSCLIGITGSNGKTTTTSLAGHILRKYGLPTVVAGNIGTPLVGALDRIRAETDTVVELSSFQLELIESFRPNIAVLLNLTADHLDRHGSLAAYSRAKARIFENQVPADAAIVNADDANAAALAPAAPRVYWFSRKKRVSSGASLRGEEIVFQFHDQGPAEVLLRLADVNLLGAHNLENVLAAVSAARIAGVDPKAIPEAVRSFPGVEHRIEFAAEIHGVRYYNDSKATNVDATLKALDAFPGRVILILGGKDKDSDYTPLRSTLREKTILALLIGAAADKIEKQIDGCVAIKRAGSLKNAVEFATQSAHPGDIVLLSPACASFDQFQNYEHRGRVFKELVRRWAGGGDTSQHKEEKNPEQTEKRNAETFGK